MIDYQTHYNTTALAFILGFGTGGICAAAIVAGIGVAAWVAG